MFIFESDRGLRFKDIIEYPEIKIKENTYTFITGESGAGKSTYLRLLNKTLLPSAGTINYRGQDIKDLPPLEYRRKVVLIPQEVFLIEGTIKENFDFYYDSIERARLNEVEIQQILRVCIADFPLTSQCGLLSGGERQRVFLAIFMSLYPDVLLLDEPTAALDEANSLKLLTNINEFGRSHNISIIVICHNDELTNQFAEEIIEIKRGEI
ncbi:MAG: ABC transporter ATP-binding protein [Clostridiaceae bacterium]